MIKLDTQHIAVLDWAFITSDAVQTSRIPAMVRRRCSTTMKLSLEVAQQLSEGRVFDYALFCSQHGELDRSMGLLKSIEKGEPFSPTQFSLAVHNASAGQYSLMNSLQCNISALAAGENTLTMGLLEVLAYLSLNPEHTVLFLIADDHIPIEFEDLAITPDERYALGLVLRLPAEVDNGTVLSLVPAAQSESETATSPMAPAMAAWLSAASDQPLSLGSLVLRRRR
ncbi:MAG: hypothetical protein COV52_10260 [Gammaproteobacteria bacterium CG11_big_fil_rev_8_21_14_0_20_46_22]|nr:MAG: hypothetical protein COW05_09485 [Gammaproteobacteria bacterium CG12_big_fil_rev_8_21_14_0_65_46_12]PIR10080.1 MAG: hypothetical protein COV52_10260 [Gammaproteobacteria bacterium CG11_big_fil_rev_8_21_14_0_20_46_22]